MKNIKKFLIVGALVLTIGAGSLMAYADSPIRIPTTRYNDFSVEDWDEWYKERIELRNEFRKEELKRALENKEITEAEAREWEEHFDYMDEFHNKQRENDSFIGNGYGRHHMNDGHCGSGYGHGMGRGRGMGMMRGNGFRN